MYRLEISHVAHLPGNVPGGCLSNLTVFEFMMAANPVLQKREQYTSEGYGRSVSFILDYGLSYLFPGRFQFRMLFQEYALKVFYFNACDFVVLPFSDVMTSSSAMLALSFGRPIIAPAIGCLPEIITPETGLLYNPTHSDGLVEALRKCSTLDAAKMGECARLSVRRFTWDDLANITLQAYLPG